MRGNAIRLLVLTALAACTNSEKQTPVRSLFALLDSTRTGISFVNTIVTNDSLNFQRDAYVYNGAGVGVGDINNDGLPDIYFAGNTVSSRLYLNKGGMRFEDVTKRAGVATDRWATGVAMVDINNDGYLDIYVSVSGPQWTPAAKRANLLFINNRNGTFTESAAKYGVADTGFTTQAAFFDYNRDNCLDVFLLNGSAKDFKRTDLPDQPLGGIGKPVGVHNELYRNNCNGTFTNVSGQAGIAGATGFGLGVAIADLNQDGWPDIYVSNDIAPNDVVYMNSGNGTFTNKRASWLKHTSYSGMGVDVADFNNDGWPDILQVDMLPRDLSQRKRTTGSNTVAAVSEARRRGFLDDFTSNTLQLSNGLSPKGDVVFSDIAHLAGIAATDWSWSALFTDFDNDGNKDILITTGYPKAVNDRDYALPPLAVSHAFGSQQRRDPLQMLTDLYAYNVPNYVFRNRGDLTFEDDTKVWGMDQASFSYGAAYVDLDNDGRLDVVVNNMNSPAFIYWNSGGTHGAQHYLTLNLVGDSPNRGGIGTQLALTAGGKKQYLYQSPYRGYMSTVDERPHFGLGPVNSVDTLEIEWPDGRRQTLTNLPVDRLLTVKQSDATAGKPESLISRKSAQRFEAIKLLGVNYAQGEATQLDYRVQPLLPYLISKHGPPLAVADVNGDGLDDLFVGGGGGEPGKLFIQQVNGEFVESRGQPWEADKGYEDWSAVFFDANGDGRTDLYVASGGYQLAPGSGLLEDRLYLNQGAGRFVRDANALPPMLTSKSVVRAGDFNGDGRPDLFIGGRLQTRSYPYPTRSYILRNDGGRFTDVTKLVAPDLLEPGGMITDAQWVDFDGDGRLDLVTAGEWMPINFYRNEGTRFHNVTNATGLPSMRGWWYALATADFDHDGRPDIVAGNLGLNYAYTTSKDSPFGVYAGDFTGNRVTDVILTKSIGGIEYPFQGLAPLGWQMYPLAIRFPTYGSFANAPLKEVLTENQRQNAVHYQTDTFASQYLHNEGGGKFSARPLPNLAQIAPIKAVVANDVDGDGDLDLIIVGNLYDAEPNTPRDDAGNGLWLRGDGRGEFLPVSPRESGFLAPRAASSIATMRARKGAIVVVANTADSLQFFRIRSR
ncbi:MAG TPA: VCBS repeat-containing protein [Gemmatimonadaceae bacterium]